MSNDNALIHAWTAEYQKMGIPSSFRKDPTRVLVEFLNSLRQKEFGGKAAADLGCGRGRNSFYLASLGFSVTSIDFLEEHVNFVNEQAREMNLPVRGIAQSVTEPWPISPHSLDIAIDIFCYKHITSKAAQKNYRRELWKTLKPDGLFLISLASINDGFYGPLLEHSPCKEEKLILDPYANVPSYLYSISDLTAEFSDLFTLIDIKEQSSHSPMHGKKYERRVLNGVFKKSITHED